MQKDKGSLSLPHLQDNIFHKANTRESGGEGRGIQGKNAGIDNGYGPIINDCFERREDKHACISSLGRKKAGRSGGRENVALNSNDLRLDSLSPLYSSRDPSVREHN